MRLFPTSRRLAAPLFAAAILVGTTGAAAAEAMDDDLFLKIVADELEYRVQDGSDLLTWEGMAHLGNDDHAVALKTRGAYELDHDAFENAEFQLLYQRPVDDFFDLQAGIRHDIRPHPARTFAVLGLTGLAPQWIEFDASTFLSERGYLSARLEVEYDILLTQRLILQPSAELALALSDDRETGVGAGLVSLEAGLRLRYEITRDVAPYVGVNWERRFGETARFVRAEGGDPNELAGVFGIRLSY
jgi:copper resistance protein B